MKIIAQSLISVFLLTTLFLPVQNAKAATPAIYADGVLAYTNAQRYRHGLPLLESNRLLSEVARQKMQDLFAFQYFAHESPDGETVSDLVEGVGYRYIAVGENLALGDFENSKGVVEAWMESEGHRENVLSETYSEIGIAAGRSDYEGRYTWIIVQSFGLPRSSCPELSSSDRSEVKHMEQVLNILRIVAEIRERALEDKDVSRFLYNARVLSYNHAAELYNNKVKEYRVLIGEFNDGVESYNSCVESMTKHS